MVCSDTCAENVFFISSIPKLDKKTSFAIFFAAVIYLNFFTSTVPPFFESHLFQEGRLQTPLNEYLKDSLIPGSSAPTDPEGEFSGVNIHIMFKLFRYNFNLWQIYKSLFFGIAVSTIFLISRILLKNYLISILITASILFNYPIFLHTFIFDEPFIVAESFKLLAIYLLLNEIDSKKISVKRQLLIAICAFIAIRTYHPTYSFLGFLTILIITKMAFIKKYFLLVLFVLLVNIPRHISALTTTRLGHGVKLILLGFFAKNLGTTMINPLINFNNLYNKSFPQIITFWGVWLFLIAILILIFKPQLTKIFPKIIQNKSLKETRTIKICLIWILVEIPLWFVLPETATRYFSSLMPPTIILLFTFVKKTLANIKQNHYKKAIIVIIVFTFLINITNIAYTTAFRVGWGSSFVGQGNVVGYLETARNNTKAIALYQAMQVAPDFIALNKTSVKYSTRTDVEYVMITNLTKQLTNLSKTKKTIFVIKRITSIKKQEYPAINLTQFKNLEKIQTIKGQNNSLFDKMWTTFASRIQPNTFEIYRLKQSK